MRTLFNFRAFLLAIAVAAVYGPAMNGDLVWDDTLYLTLNPNIAARDGLARIWLDPQSSPSPYPLVFTTYWIEHKLWSFRTTGYHAVNLAFHIINSLLIIALLRRLGLRAAEPAGWLFALHPAHVESVAWITERKDVLSIFFYLVSALAWLEFTARGRRRDYALSLSAFVLAMLSKTVVCTLPVVLALLPCARAKLPPVRRPLLLAPFFFLALALGLATIWWEKTQTGATASNVGLALADRFHLAARVPWFYLGKTLWPGPLMGVYPRWATFDQSSIGGIFIAFAAACTAGLFILRRRFVPVARWSALFFIVTLGPALGFLDFSTMAYSFVADHFQYLASLGLIVAMLEWLLRAAAGARAPHLRFLSAAFALLILAAASLPAFHRARAFESSESFFRDTLEKNPTAWVAWTNVGAALARRGEFDEAVSHFERALKIYPDEHETSFKLGQTFALMGDAPRAEQTLRASLTRAPAYAEARSALGAILIQQGRPDEARAEFERAAADGPRLFEPPFYLGSLALRRNDANAAVEYLIRAVQLNPSSAEAHFNLGLARRALGDESGAALALDEAVRLRPDLEPPVPPRP